jgi:hypothetical protein
VTYCELSGKWSIPTSTYFCCNRILKAVFCQCGRSPNVRLPSGLDTLKGVTRINPTASRTPGAVFCIPKTRTAHPKVDRCVLLRVSAYSSARMAASSSSISQVTAARFASSTLRRLFR